MSVRLGGLTAWEGDYEHGVAQRYKEPQSQIQNTSCSLGSALMRHDFGGRAFRLSKPGCLHEQKEEFSKWSLRFFFQPLIGQDFFKKLIERIVNSFSPVTVSHLPTIQCSLQHLSKWEFQLLCELERTLAFLFNFGLGFYCNNSILLHRPHPQSPPPAHPQFRGHFPMSGWVRGLRTRSRMSSPKKVGGGH